ncbi:MAG TPA: thioredoxin domain-containing protein [Solirubrobacterales bacterium]|nr:thioredoxin domain-containing protein [Solirubrobacterales bacterium]
MANRLAEETSPYLLQHKDNPVEWYAWGPEALEHAEREDKPILLSIGYAACHWCHVMERESFEDAEAAAYMNEHFVCIKVDREERPDLDAIYMEAVQGMTGHGGWPMTVFLDPEGVPFYGGTYFPPEPRHGMPSFRMVMEAVVESWATQRERIRASAARIRDQLGAIGRLEPSTELLSPDLVRSAIGRLRTMADPRHGGFGGAPKFPPAAALELLLAHGVEDVVQVTLDAMAHGGIYDQVGGGFARYSVDETWLVPHFEKMLYDNALLARAYLHGWQALAQERWRRVATDTLDWALREMRGPEGGFYSSLDADSEGEEGRFYVWSPEQIREALGAAGLGDAADGVIAYYGVTERGNFEGRNILHLPGGPAAEPPEGLDEARRALRESRAERVWPSLDDKRLASWNALMIAALAESGAVLGREDHLEAAVRCAEFVWTQMRSGDGRLRRSWKDGEARLSAYLEDYAYLLEGLLTLYEASFEVRWFDAARQTADLMIELFADSAHGGFFTTAHDHERLIARRKDVDDHPIPSGNSSAYGLLRLAALTGEHEYERHAVSVFRLLHGAATRHPHGLAHLLRAMDFHFAAVKEVALVAPASAGAQATDGAADAVAAQGAADAVAPLAAAVRSGFRPYLVLAGGPEGTNRPELMRERSAVQGKSAAYVCENFACRRPVTEPEELAAAL